MKNHIAIVDPAVKTPELDCFNRLAVRSPLPLTYHLPALFGLDSLERAAAGLKGVVILGSSSSVHDGLPWARALGSWLEARWAERTPTLGICYGHQLVAHLLGGKVDFLRPDREKLQGFQEVVVEEGPWGKGRGPLFVSHREAVTRCPPGMRVIARRPHVPIDGLAHETLPVWTFQAHPEATEAFLRNVGYTGPAGDFAFGHSLVDAFLRYVVKK